MLWRVEEWMVVSPSEILVPASADVLAGLVP